MDTYETLNELLVSFFREIMILEEQAIITEEYRDITNNDMHVIQAVGVGKPKNMSAIAKELSVTVGTLTIAMNSLVKKGYVQRERGKTDRRVVYIFLSEKGRAAYLHHEAFHRQMIDAILEQLSPEETEVFVKSLTRLEAWFRSGSFQGAASSMQGVVQEPECVRETRKNQDAGNGAADAQTGGTMTEDD